MFSISLSSMPIAFSVMPTPFVVLPTPLVVLPTAFCFLVLHGSGLNRLSSKPRAPSRLRRGSGRG